VPDVTEGVSKVLKDPPRPSPFSSSLLLSGPSTTTASRFILAIVALPLARRGGTRAVRPDGGDDGSYSEDQLPTSSRRPPRHRAPTCPRGYVSSACLPTLALAGPSSGVSPEAQEGFSASWHASVRFFPLSGRIISVDRHPRACCPQGTHEHAEACSAYESGGNGRGTVSCIVYFLEEPWDIICALNEYRCGPIIWTSRAWPLFGRARCSKM